MIVAIQGLTTLEVAKSAVKLINEVLGAILVVPIKGILEAHGAKTHRIKVAIVAAV